MTSVSTETSQTLPTLWEAIKKGEDPNSIFNAREQLHITVNKQNGHISVQNVAQKGWQHFLSFVLVEKLEIDYFKGRFQTITKLNDFDVTPSSVLSQRCTSETNKDLPTLEIETIQKLINDHKTDLEALKTSLNNKINLLQKNNPIWETIQKVDIASQILTQIPQEKPPTEKKQSNEPTDSPQQITQTTETPITSTHIETIKKVEETVTEKFTPSEIQQKDEIATRPKQSSETRMQLNTYFQNYLHGYEDQNGKRIPGAFDKLMKLQNAFSTGLRGPIYKLISERIKTLHDIKKKLDSTTEEFDSKQLTNLVVFTKVIDDGILNLMNGENKPNNIDELLHASYRNLQVAYAALPELGQNKSTSLQNLSIHDLNLLKNQINKADINTLTPDQQKAKFQFLIASQITTALLEATLGDIAEKKQKIDTVRSALPETPRSIKSGFDVITANARPNINEKTSLTEIAKNANIWNTNSSALEETMKTFQEVSTQIHAFLQSRDKVFDDLAKGDRIQLQDFNLGLPDYPENGIPNRAQILAWKDRIISLQTKLHHQFIDAPQVRQSLIESIDSLTPMIEAQKLKLSTLKRAYPHATFTSIEKSLNEIQSKFQSKKTHSDFVVPGWISDSSKPIKDLNLEELQVFEKTVQNEVAQEKERLSKDPFGLEAAITAQEAFDHVCDEITKVNIPKYQEKTETVPLAYALRISIEKKQIDLKSLCEQSSKAETLHQFATNLSLEKQKLIERRDLAAQRKTDVDFLKLLGQVTEVSPEALLIKRPFIESVKQEIEAFDKEMDAIPRQFAPIDHITINKEQLVETIKRNRELLKPLKENQRTIQEGVTGLKKSVTKALTQLSGLELIAYQQEVRKTIQEGRDAVQLFVTTRNEAQTAQNELNKTIEETKNKIKALKEENPPQYLSADLLQETLDGVKQSRETFLKEHNNKIDSYENLDAFSHGIGKARAHLNEALKNIELSGSISLIEQLTLAQEHPENVSPTLIKTLHDAIKQDMAQRLDRASQIRHSQLERQGIKDLPEAWKKTLKENLKSLDKKLDSLKSSFTSTSWMLFSTTKKPLEETMNIEDYAKWEQTIDQETKKAWNSLNDFFIFDVADQLNAYDAQLKKAKNKVDELRKIPQLVAANALQKAIDTHEQQRLGTLPTINSAKGMEQFAKQLRKAVEDLVKTEENGEKLELEDQLVKLESQTSGSKLQTAGKSFTDYGIILLKSIVTIRKDIDEHVQKLRDLSSAVDQMSHLAPAWKEQIKLQLTEEINNIFVFKLDDTLKFDEKSAKAFREFKQKVDSRIKKSESIVEQLIPLKQFQSAVNMYGSKELAMLEKINVLRIEGKFALAADLQHVFMEQSSIYQQKSKQFNNANEIKQFCTAAQDAVDRYETILEDVENREGLSDNVPSTKDQMHYLEKKYGGKVVKLPDYKTLHDLELQPALKQLSEKGDLINKRIDILKKQKASSEWLTKANALNKEIEDLKKAFTPMAANRFEIADSIPVNSLNANQLVEYKAKVAEVLTRLNQFLSTAQSTTSFQL